MEKQFMNGLIFGRFQVPGPHIGHHSLIELATKLCKNLVIMIGSTQEYGTERNPFCYETRARMFREKYGSNYNGCNIILRDVPDMTHEGDITPEWGRYVLGKNKLVVKTHPCVMIYGNDESRSRWFDTNDIPETSEIILPRARIPVAATETRELMALDKRDEWCEKVPKELHPFFDELRGELMQVNYYKFFAEGSK